MTKITKKDLYDYRELKLEIIDLEESRTKLQKLIDGFQSSKFKPIAKDERKTLTDAMIRMETLDRVYLNRIGDNSKRILHVEDFINNLKCPEERKVIRYRYVFGMEWEEVCVKAHVGWDKAHRINKRVLAKIS